MPSIKDVLTASGLVVQATSSGRAIATFVRETYKALADGAESVYVFTQDASEGLLAAFADTDECVNGAAFVVQTNGDYTAKQVRAKIDYRNKLNVDKNNKPRSDVTLGSVRLANIVDPSSGDTVGVEVVAA